MEDSGQYAAEFDDYKSRLDWVLMNLDFSHTDRKRVQDAVEINFNISSHGYELRALLDDGIEYTVGKKKRRKE